MKEKIKNDFIKTYNQYQKFLEQWNNNITNQQIDQLLPEALDIAERLSVILDDTLEVLKASVSSRTFLQTLIDSYIQDFQKITRKVKIRIPP